MRDGTLGAHNIADLREIDCALAMLGCPDVAGLNRDCVFRPAPADFRLA